MNEKEIYFFWGNQPMSFLRFMTIKSFNLLNPDWKINLIVNKFKSQNTWKSIEKQDNTTYFGYDYMNKLNTINNLNIIELDSICPFDYKSMSNVHIKDVLNWFLLSTKTCIVADMDIMFCKPINETNGIDWDSNVNICCFDFYRNYIPVSFMISKITEDRINPFYQEVYNNSLKFYNPNVYESCGTISIKFNGIDEIISHFKSLKIHKMDHMTVFPFVAPHPGKAGTLCWFDDRSHLFTENTIGVHWYAGQPESQKHNILITEENFSTFNNVITNIIKKIYK